MLAAVRIMAERKKEITGWLVRESGGALAKAELEWQLVRAEMLEAASMPHRATGSIMPSDIPGKESRVYRQPAGVVAVISPWNFPLQLSNRSVAPALACGNAVVLKPASDTPVTGGLLLARIFEEAGLPPACCPSWWARAAISATRWSPTRCRPWCRSPGRPRSARGSSRPPGSSGCRWS
jgi:aldehyde dehydrogenase (NAD+)